MMNRFVRFAHDKAGFVFHSAMVVGSVATFVAGGFIEAPADEYRHQREHGFLSADFWMS